MKNNRIAALGIRFTAFILSFTVLLNHLEIFQGKFNGDILYYYTNQSNVLAVFLFGLLTVRTIIGLLRNGHNGSSNYFSQFEMIVAVDVFLTFIVYWILLAPTSFTMDGNTNIFNFTNIVLHGVTPLLVIFDYYIFSKPGILKIRDAFAVTIFPMLYVGFATIVGFSGHVFSISPVDHKPVRFAYFFFDYDRIGWMAIPYILAVMIFLIIIGLGMYWIDQKKSTRLTKIKINH